MSAVTRPDVERVRSLMAPRSEFELVVLFGSMASGVARPDSDMDVAILPSGPFSAADEARLVDELERVSGRDVDLVRLDRVDDVVLRREIARGVPVREQTPGGFARFAADAALEWLDLEPVYNDAQARFLRRIAERIP